MIVLSGIPATGTEKGSSGWQPASFDGMAYSRLSLNTQFAFSCLLCFLTVALPRFEHDLMALFRMGVATPLFFRLRRLLILAPLFLPFRRCLVFMLGTFTGRRSFWGSLVCGKDFAHTSIATRGAPRTGALISRELGKGLDLLASATGLDWFVHGCSFRVRYAYHSTDNGASQHMVITP